MNLNRREMLKVGGFAGITAVAISAPVFLTGCSASTWLQIAIADLPTITKIVTTILAIAGATSPGVAAAIQVGVTAVQTGIALVQQLIADYKANPSASLIQKIESTLNDIQSQLGTILAAAHIENTVLVATITGLVGLAVTAVTAILSLIPQTTMAGALRAPRGAIKPMTPAEIQAQCNSILVRNGFGSYAW